MSTETAKWCNSFEKSLCELLIVQILGGKKPKSFVKEAWIEVKDEFNKKNGQNFTMDQIKNMYNLLRLRHNDMKKLMSLSGFEWDSEDKNIIVDDEGVWDAYLGENPDKKSIRQMAALSMKSYVPFLEVQLQLVLMHMLRLRA